MYTHWRINKLITAQGREEIATDVGWKATSHETYNARPDLLLAKHVRRLDTSQSFEGPRAKKNQERKCLSCHQGQGLCIHSSIPIPHTHNWRCSVPNQWDWINDNIIIHGGTVKEHDVRLRKTFKHIQEKGLTLNRDKFAFSMSKLTFMGYLLSNQGIGPTESHVEAVVDAREPQNPFSGISEL